MSLEVPDEMLEDYHHTTVTNKPVINYVPKEEFKENKEDSKDLYILILIILLLLVFIIALVRYIYKNTDHNKEKTKSKILKKKLPKTSKESTFARSAFSRYIKVDGHRLRRAKPIATERRGSRLKFKRKRLNKFSAQRRKFRRNHSQIVSQSY